MRCPKLVSHEFGYGQCAWDAGHTQPCHSPDWLAAPPVPAGERREELVRKVFGWLFTAEEINLAMDNSRREAILGWLGALFDEGALSAALPAARPEPPTLLYECEFVSVSAIRALIQQWRAQMGASWPERAATLDQCADELDAICPAPAAEEEKSPTS